MIVAKKNQAREGGVVDLLGWQNLIFELPFVAALAYVLLSMGTVPIGHDVEADTDVDHDYDHGIEHAVGHGHGAEGEYEVGSLARALSFLGIGKVPLSIIVTSFCFVWGFVGWACNLILSSVVPYPGAYVWVSGIAAFFGSLFATRSIAHIVAKIMPKMETYGVDREYLIGRTGSVRYDVSETFGSVQVHDRYGTLHEVECRVRAGEAALPSGSEATLLEYQPEKGVFIAVTKEEFDRILASDG